MNLKDIVNLVTQHTDQLRYLRESIQSQSQSMTQSLENVNAATVALLRDHSENILEPAMKEVHERITTLEVTLEAFIKLILVSDNSEVTEEQYNEIKQVVVDFIAPK